MKSSRKRVQVEMQQQLEECVRSYAELRALIRLVRVKERALLAALGRLSPEAPAAALLPGLERVVGETVSGRRGPPG